MKKKRYTKIEKKRLVGLMDEYQIESIEKEYGLSRSSLYRWRNQIDKGIL
ncbi:transposase [Aliivibrio sp. EL58]|nr:transposase [Aliivibrio sp. EL58]